MATSSFQATTFDYLRVVFHRMRWIVILIFLSVSLAWVYVTFLLPKSYMSDMTVMVWSKDRDNQLVRRMISQTPLEALIDSIRSKLRVDRRLRNLACNLRFAVKEDYYARVLNQPGGLMAVDEKGLDELFAGLLRQYAAGKKIYSGPGGMMARWGRWPVSTSDKTLDLKSLAGNLDVQSLARIVADVDDYSTPFVDQVIGDLDTDDKYVGALHEKLGVKDHGEVFSTVFVSAISELYQRLVAENKTPGGGNFSLAAKRELVKEMLSAESLFGKRLYSVTNAFAGKGGLHYWVDMLKDGLAVTAVHANLMTFHYDEVLYNNDRPFAREGNPNVISHIVVKVAYAMIESEFRKTERSLWNDALGILDDRRKVLEKELDILNRDLFNLEKLEKLQLSFPVSNQQNNDSDGKNPNSVINPFWADPFTGTLPQTSTHILRINALTQEIDSIDKELAELRATAEQLARQIKDPTQQWIISSMTTRKQLPPEYLAIRGKLVLKELERRKLSESATAAHPFMIKLDREIRQLQRALQEQAPSEGMEEMTKRENPQVREWTRELAETERRVKALEARRAKVVELVDQERDKAEEAIRNQREYQDKKTRHDELRRQLSDILGQREAMIAKQQASKTFDVVFEVHTDSAKPSRHYEPKESLVILMALLVGIAAAVGMVFFLEFTDHSIKTTEDVKRHLNLPVLGTIPEFSFAEIEGFERYSRYGGLFGGRGRREVYPISMDKHSPEPLAQRPKVRTGNSARRQIIAMIIAGVVLAGILALMGLFGNISLPFGFWGGADGSDAIGNSASGESGSK